MAKLLRFLKSVDWLVLIPAVYLLIVGVVVQYAILFKTRGEQIDFTLDTQIVSIVVGVGAVAFLALAKPLGWRKYAVAAYILSLGLLGLVIFSNQEAGGAVRWVSVGGFQFQPSELAKLTTILMLARLFDHKTTAVNRFNKVLSSLFIVVLPAGLVLLQPDLGSAVVFVFIWIAMILASKMKYSRLVVVGLVVVATIIISVPFMADYQQQRLVSYFNPSSDEAGANYNSIQATIAIGSGGLFGNGLDSGTQSQLNFLPSQHTDFIFAVTAEKLGVLGAGSVILALSVLIGRIMVLGINVRDKFQRGVVVGIGALLFFHAFVNIGMNLSLLPVTGLPLPFVSYGGTFMAVTIISIGMVLIISFGQNKAALKQ